jgi:integrase
MGRKTAKRQQFRNENGFGSIVKLGGNRRKPYAVRVTTGWENGKQVRKYVGYYETQADALIALAEYHKGTVNLDLSKLTLGEVFEKWYSRLEPTASKAVLSSHKMSKDRLGDLGKKPIKDIKLDHLQDWFNGINLKPASKNKIKSTMGQLFEYAEQNDIVRKNPAKFLKTDGEIEKVGKVFSQDEINFLWEHSEEHVDYQTWLILIYTGMRIGELLTIKLEDLHLDEGYGIGGIKTKAGKNRVIPFHDKIIPIIKDRVEKYGCLVPNVNGSPATYIAFQHRFARHMEKLNWEHKIHDTRKTGISIMHSSGIPMEVIRVIVGHSAKGVTEQVYLYKEASELVEYINKIKI